MPLRTGRVLYPATAAVLAVLTLGTVVAALPCPRTAEVAMTSGGKFAARIPGADEPRAERPAGPMSGLPLPSLVQPSGGAGVPWLPAASVEAANGEGLVAKTLTAALDWRMMPTLASDPHPGASSITVQARMLALEADATSAKPGAAWMPSILSSVRSLGSMAVSAGGSILSRLLRP